MHYLFAYQDFISIFVVLCASASSLLLVLGEMPPKTRQGEARSVELATDDLDSEYSASSPLSAASTVSTASASTILMTAEQLQAVLEANNRSMMALLERRTTPVPPATPKIIKVEVPKWKDGDSPSEYLSKYEKAQHHNGVPREQWGVLLEVYLTDKAQGAYAQVDPTKIEDYALVKSTILRSLGDTPAEADRRWWTLRRKPGETIGSFYLRMRTTGTRRFDGLETREQIFEKVLLSRFLSLLAPDCYTCVAARNPKNGEEAAEMVAEYEHRGEFSKTYLAGEAAGKPFHRNHFFKCESGNGGANGSFKNQEVVSGSPGNEVKGTGSGSGSSNVSTQNANPNYKSNGKGRQEKFAGKRQVVCYGCGVEGHIKPNCPNKVRRIKLLEEKKVKECCSTPVVDGYLAGVAVAGLRVDTGADTTVVRAEYVPQATYTDKKIVLDSWRGDQTSHHRLARITIRVGKVEVLSEVAVSDTLEFPALLGNDLERPLKLLLREMLVAQLSEPLDEVIESCNVQKPVEVVRSTRAQVAKEQEEDAADELASAQSECTPVSLGAIFDLSDEFFEDDDPVPTPVEELMVWPEGGVGR